MLACNKVQRANVSLGLASQLQEEHPLIESKSIEIEKASFPKRSTGFFAVNMMTMLNLQHGGVQ